MKEHLAIAQLVGLALATALIACGALDPDDSNERPTATVTILSAPLSPGARVRVSAAGSTDDDGFIRSYTFDWGDGSPDEISVEPEASHSYDEAGSYTVSVSVIDDRGAKDSASVTVNVLP